MSNDALSTETTAALLTETTAALLKELKEQRAKRSAIDATISRIEALLGVSDSADPPRTTKPKPPRELAALGPGDACVWALRQKGAPMTNREIHETLAAVGYKKMKSTDHVGAALHHRVKKPQDVRREGKHWVYVGEPSNAETRQFNGTAEQAS